jgi:hypothetical protein
MVKICDGLLKPSPFVCIANLYFFIFFKIGPLAFAIAYDLFIYIFCSCRTVQGNPVFSGFCFRYKCAGLRFFNAGLLVIKGKGKIGFDHIVRFIFGAHLV